MTYFSGVLMTLFIGMVLLGYNWHKIEDEPREIGIWATILLIGSGLWPATWAAILIVVVFWSLWRVGRALHNLVDETKQYFKEKR